MEGLPLVGPEQETVHPVAVGPFGPTLHETHGMATLATRSAMILRIRSAVRRCSTGSGCGKRLSVIAAPLSARTGRKTTTPVFVSVAVVEATVSAVSRVGALVGVLVPVLPRGRRVGVLVLSGLGLLLSGSGNLRLRIRGNKLSWCGACGGQRMVKILNLISSVLGDLLVTLVVGLDGTQHAHHLLIWLRFPLLDSVELGRIAILVRKGLFDSDSHGNTVDKLCKRVACTCYDFALQACRDAGIKLVSDLDRSLRFRRERKGGEVVEFKDVILYALRPL